MNNFNNNFDSNKNIIEIPQNNFQKEYYYDPNLLELQNIKKVSNSEHSEFSY
jgi:hypothetical protein